MVVDSEIKHIYSAECGASLPLGRFKKLANEVCPSFGSSAVMSDNFMCSLVYSKIGERLPGWWRR